MYNIPNNNINIYNQISGMKIYPTHITSDINSDKSRASWKAGF